MAKFRITIMVIIFLGTFIFCFYVIWASDVSYENKGKKALINNRDTCIIQQEEKDHLLKFTPRKITVLYKDSYGKYTEQQFQEDLITIIK